MFIGSLAWLFACSQATPPPTMPPGPTTVRGTSEFANIAYAFTHFNSQLPRDPLFAVGPLQDPHTQSMHLVQLLRLHLEEDYVLKDVYQIGPRKRELLAGGISQHGPQRYTLALTLFDKPSASEHGTLHTPYTFTDIHLHAIDGVPRYRYVWDGEYYRREAVAPPEETPSTTRAASGDGRP